ncbi:MAG: YitT family protein [Clostridium sp.]|nr:YitT family protein [Clostridium sp.]
MDLQLRRRYEMFFAGLIISAAGIAFLTRAGLVTSAISGIPFILSLVSAPSMGLYTFAFNMLYVILEAALRREVTLRQVLQVPIAILFSVCIDLFLAVIPTRFGGPYGWSLIYLVIGCLVMGLGISLEVMADVVMLPAEALVRTISRKGNFHFGSVKVVFDCVLAGIAVILALIFFGKLNGVREGTILSALTVGHIVKWYLRRLDPAREWWFGQKQADHRVVRSESR